MTRDELIRRLEAGENDDLTTSKYSHAVAQLLGVYVPPSCYPEYTTSLDAALALLGKVLPGWGWLLSRWPSGESRVSAFVANPGDAPFDGAAPTPAAALCAAILKAKGERDDG